MPSRKYVPSLRAVIGADRTRPAWTGRYSRLRGYAALTLAVLLIALPVSAQQAKIVGLGATGCAQFMLEIRHNPALQRDYLAWAQGFMSGVLLGRPAGVDEGLDLIPSTVPLLKQLEFLREYCDQNPSESFSNAVLSLYKRLRSEGKT